MAKVRVRSFENWSKGEVNPTKQFVAEFALCRSDYLDRYPFSPKEIDRIGKLGVDLCTKVARIAGVEGVTITKNQIRVYKNFTYDWNELTKPIQRAFEEVFGKGSIRFIEENPLSHFVRKTRVEFNLYKD